MLNKNDEVNASISINADDTMLSQTIAKPNVSSSKTVRAEITRILYQNSSDDSECLRIKFENIQKVIDLLVLCVGQFYCYLRKGLLVVAVFVAVPAR